LSQLLLRKLIDETALDTMPTTSKYKIHTRRLLEWLSNHGTAISLMGTAADDGGAAKPLDVQRMELLRRVFSELAGDPFWRIFQSLMLTSPEALLAKEHLPLLEAQLRAVESFDAVQPRTARDLLDGKTLHDAFYLRDRVVGIALKCSRRAYNQLHLDHDYVSEARAKRAMLRAVVMAPEIRAYWKEKCIASDDVRVLLPALPRNADARTAARAVKMLKRSMLRAIERQVALRYAGETWDELVTVEPVLAALERHRCFGRETGETVELGVYLANALVDRPTDVWAWLERSFARSDAFASRLLPELHALTGSGQDIEEDGRTLDELTYRLGLNPEATRDFTRVLDATRS
jgi:hypothetical protein